MAFHLQLPTRLAQVHTVVGGTIRLTAVAGTAAPQLRVGLRLRDWAAEVRVGDPDHGDVTGRLGGEHGLVRGEQVRCHPAVERDRVDGPQAAMVRAVPRSDAGNPELAGRPVGDGVERVQTPFGVAAGLTTVPTIDPSWYSCPLPVLADAPWATPSRSTPAITATAIILCTTHLPVARRASLLDAMELALTTRLREACQVRKRDRSGMVRHCSSGDREIQRPPLVLWTVAVDIIESECSFRAIGAALRVCSGPAGGRARRGSAAHCTRGQSEQARSEG